jgi:hypothetical protein
MTVKLNAVLGCVHLMNQTENIAISLSPALFYHSVLHNICLKTFLHTTAEIHLQ